MKRKTYYEQLQDPRWQKMRLEIFNSADWTCENCATKTKQLHAHHKYYKRGVMAWDYPIKAFKALCEECHTAHQDAMEKAHEQIANHDLVNKLTLLGNFSPEEIEFIELILSWGAIESGMRKSRMDFLRASADALMYEFLAGWEHGKEE